ncbi:unnamed protein product [Amoebophrya sp. A25]|nr:unnamed protein product [Amoebophrya sp. A25]|eukprot:GSA25T00007147001.1
MGCILSSPRITDKDHQDLQVPDAMNLIYVKRSMYSANESDRFDYFGHLKLKGPIKRLGIFADWADQGYGNQKGEIKVQLMGPDQAGGELAKVTMGPAGHQRKLDTKIIEEDDPMCKESGELYELHFYFKVGGGGGHSLSIYKFGIGVVYRGGPTADMYVKPDIQSIQPVAPAGAPGGVLVPQPGGVNVIAQPVQPTVVIAQPGMTPVPVVIANQPGVLSNAAFANVD